MTNNEQNNNVKKQCEKFLGMLIEAAPYASNLTRQDYKPQLKEIATLINTNRFLEAYAKMTIMKAHFDQVNQTIKNKTAKVLNKMNQELSLLKKKQEALMVDKNPVAPSDVD